MSSRPASTAPRTPPPGSGTHVRPGRLLVIDDEPLIGKALARALGAEHSVVAVDGAAAALERLRAGERYDVVLCDVMMPQTDGVEFYKQLRAVLPEEAERLVFATGGALEATTRAFLETASNLLLEKPVDLTLLRSLLEQRVRTQTGPAAGTGSNAL